MGRCWDPLTHNLYSSIYLPSWPWIKRTLRSLSISVPKNWFINLPLSLVWTFLLILKQGPCLCPLKNCKYSGKCASPARPFLNQMIQFVRDMGDNRTVFHISEDFKDLNWFSTFLGQLNRVLYQFRGELYLDACITFFGGILAPNVMQFQILKLLSQVLNF